jgi:hypothetical protein
LSNRNKVFNYLSWVFASLDPLDHLASDCVISLLIFFLCFV